jgi:hypothetical protein
MAWICGRLRAANPKAQIPNSKKADKNLKNRNADCGAIG